MSAPTIRNALDALSLASQIDSLELRERHLARARVIVNLLRDEIARVEADLCAREAELARRIAAAALPGVSK